MKPIDHSIITPDLTLPALSIRQPWAWLILHGGKNVENRSWNTRFRGRFLIHAAKGATRMEYDDVCRLLVEHFEAYYAPGRQLLLPTPAGPVVHMPQYETLQRGGIVGEAEIVDCVQQMDSPWFFGPVGFVLRFSRPLRFTPCRGSLGFFKWKRPSQPGPSLNSSRTAIDVGLVVSGTS